MEIRNFCIIAHIDHGKSTLADRMIESTGTLQKREMKEQLLDTMDLERERGITIKLQPVRMQYKGVQLNLIDTPGHTDFRYEVSRSLAACEGAILLVDASQGIQAQTLAVLSMALEHDLAIVPVLNKIDLPVADPERVTEEVLHLLGCRREEILRISAKDGRGVEDVLKAVIDRVPKPSVSSSADARALIFDAVMDPYRGAVAYVRMVEGSLKKGQKMVFAGLYPSEADGYPQLRDALEKLSLNDAALFMEPERNAALGNGFRCGFLGLLHMDIVQERLEREHDCDLVITAPSVQYEVQLQSRNPGEVVRTSLLRADEPAIALISNPADFPDPTCIGEVREPWVGLEVLCRKEDVGPVMQLVQDRRGMYQSLEYLDADLALLRFEVPLQGIILDFFDRLKSATAGYGSMSYEPIGYRAGDLVKLQILLLGEPAEALSTIVHKSEAHSVGAIICKKLKEVLPKAQYQIPIQAAVGAKVVARETLSAYRKDVTGYLYGGDVTRKRKLLEKQKKGKKRLKQMGKITLTQEAFLSVLKR